MATWPPIDRDDLVAAASKAGFDTDLPLLVRRLIAETANGLTRLDMPGGSGTAAGGFDGVVAAGGHTIEVPAGGHTIEVPAGTSVWELSVTAKAQGKADDDYGKRLDGPDGTPTADVTYVQAILAPWTKHSTWAAARRKERRWKDVVALNLDAVHGWLDRAPATTAWLAERLGKAMPGVRLLDQWWSDTWLPSTRPELTPELVLAGRQDQARTLVDLLASGRSVVTLGGELGGDGLKAFVAASLAAVDDPHGPVLRARAIHVTDPTSLAQLVRQPGPLVIVLDDAQLAADLPASHPHRLVLVAPPGGTNDVAVPPIDAQDAEALLRTTSETHERAGELGRLARRSLPALRRALALNPTPLTPEWAREPDRVRRRLLLLGAWEGNSDGDRDAVSRCVGRPYDDVQETATALSRRADYPMLGHLGEHWHLTSPEDAWLLLRPHLSQDDLAAFRTTALAVLAEADPLAGLPPDEQFRMQIHGAQRTCSAALRRGLAQTLALLGSSADPIAAGGPTGADQARLVVRELFAAANADSTYAAWASLGDVLSLLAEAAPDEFLRALGDGLRGHEPLHAQMFAENDDAFGSAPSPHIAFLWALETVAWSADHFDDAVQVLARLAALDPGGRLENRPARSLAEVLSVWHPETSASEEQRHQALQRLLGVEPDVARALLLDLIPDGHGFQTAHPGPRFRGWKALRPVVVQDDVLRRTSYIADLLLDDLGDDLARHRALIARIADLPAGHRALLTAHLAELAGRLDDAARAALHDALRDVTAHHREYADTFWALPDAELTALEAAMHALRPHDPVRRVAWLFAADDVELGDHVLRNDIPAYDAEVARRRVEAVAEVLADGGLAAVERLAVDAPVPQAVGAALASTASHHDPEMLAWLAAGDSEPDAAARTDTAYAYLARRLRDDGPRLLDDLVARTDEPVAIARLLRAAGDPQDAWRRLTELPDSVAEQYWKRFSYYGLGRQFPAVLEAARGLISVRRHAVTLRMMSHFAEQIDTNDGADAAAAALEGLLAGGMSDPELASLRSHDYQRLFALLGRHREAVGEHRVVNLEWQLFPALGWDADVPTLHAALADQPAFFAELVRHMYRPDPATDHADPRAADGDEAEAGDKPDSPLDTDQRRQFAVRARRLLQSWRRCPGAGADNKPDPQALRAWIEQARARLAIDGRQEVGDLEIGQALARATPDDDGMSPPRAVRDLLEDIRSDRLDEGLALGILNQRGVTTRGAYDGGAQERDLADAYRRAADDAVAWPRTRRLLRGLAEDYERDTHREEDRAERLRRGLGH